MNKLMLKKKLLQTMLATAITIQSIEGLSFGANAEQIESTMYEDMVISNLIEAYLKHYTKIYNLDYYRTSEILHDHLYLSENEISIDGVNYDSSEEAIITFVNNLYFHPEQYGTEMAKIMTRSCNRYEISQSLEEIIYNYSKVLDINHNIALSIVYSECGAELDSRNYRVNNNPAGIGPHMYFPNEEAGVLYFLLVLKHGYGLKMESEEEFFNRVSKKYCLENPDQWESLANDFYYNIKDDYLYYNIDLKTKYAEYLSKEVHSPYEDGTNGLNNNSLNTAVDVVYRKNKQ